MWEDTNVYEVTSLKVPVCLREDIKRIREVNHVPMWTLFGAGVALMKEKGIKVTDVRGKAYNYGMEEKLPCYGRLVSMSVSLPKKFIPNAIKILGMRIDEEAYIMEGDKAVSKSDIIRTPVYVLVEECKKVGGHDLFCPGLIAEYWAKYLKMV